MNLGPTGEMGERLPGTPPLRKKSRIVSKEKKCCEMCLKSLKLGQYLIAAGTSELRMHAPYAS